MNAKRYLYKPIMKRALLRTIILMVLSVNLTHAQALEGGILDKRIDVSFEGAGLIQVLTTLAVVNRIPIGYEKSLNEDASNMLRLVGRNLTVKNVLDRIVEMEPRYRWEHRKGVINFTPQVDRSLFIEKLLGVHIDQFNPKKGASKFVIRDALLELPEVQTALKAGEINGQRFYYAYKRSIYSDDSVDLQCSNASLREVLNNIVLKSEHKIWVVELSGDKQNNLFISF